MDIFAYPNKTKALDAYFFTIYTLKKVKIILKCCLLKVIKSGLFYNSHKS